MSKTSKVESLDFDGMAGDGVNKSGDRFAGNHFSEKMKENFGSGPRRASENSQASMHEHGKSVTFDKYRTAPATAAGPKPIGSRSWEPKAGQNYSGNADKINVGSK
jgi:hypothetical protein